MIEQPKLNFRDVKIIAHSVSGEDYRSNIGKRGDTDYVMTRSSLMDFVVCPERWINGYEGGESKSTEWGNLIDCMVLTPLQFGSRYVIIPKTYPDSKTGEPKEWNFNAAYCKKWRADHAGKQAIKRELEQEACEATKRLLNDIRVRDMLSGEGTKTQVWVKGIYVDPETNMEVPIQSLIDIVPSVDGKYGRGLADLKTTQSAHTKAWQKSVHKFNYDAQAAISMDLWNKATAEDRTDWFHVVQESYAPYQVGRKLLSCEFIEQGRTRASEALKKYCQCLKTGKWPDYEDDHRNTMDGWTIVQPESWMVGG